MARNMEVDFTYDPQFTRCPEMLKNPAGRFMEFHETDEGVR